jgi:GDSL-like Lipase/Acylhydrolase family
MADAPVHYVALGDSISIDDYSGGPGRGGASLLFANRDDDFPMWRGRDLLTADRETAFSLLATDGATTRTLLGTQLPRLAALPVRPTLVTVTIGGNDVLGAYGDTKSSGNCTVEGEPADMAADVRAGLPHVGEAGSAEQVRNPAAEILPCELVPVGPAGDPAVGGGGRPANVDQVQRAAGAQHPSHLPYHQLPLVDRHVVEHERREDDVHAVVGVGKLVGVSAVELDGQSAAAGLAAGAGQRRQVRVQADDGRGGLGLLGRQQQVTGAAADLQDPLSGADAGLVEQPTVDPPDAEQPGQRVVQREQPAPAHPG